MAQKVNSISLRIANKIVWDSVLSEDNKTHYLITLRSIEIKKYAILLFNFLNLKGSETMVKFQNGSTNINFKNSIISLIISPSQNYKIIAI